MTTTLTLDLARFAVGAAAIPDQVQTSAARAISAVVGAAAAGADSPAVDVLAELASSFGTPPEAGVPGRTERYAASWSALLTAAAASSTVSAGYPTVVVAAALATAGARNLGLRPAAEAVAVGLEVTARLDNWLAGSLGPFDPVPVLGRLGAAAAAARLLGLTPDATAHGFGVAATQAAGLLALAGEAAADLQNGKAAADGVEAAWLAAGGFTGPRAAIEGRRGLAALLAPDAVLAADAGARLAAAADGLGRTWSSAAVVLYPRDDPADLDLTVDACLSSFPPAKRSRQ
jgi:2-methylcitrate dehydratase PrpD